MSVHLVDLTKLTLFLLGLVNLINPFNLMGWFSGTIDTKVFGCVYESYMKDLELGSVYRFNRPILSCESYEN
jgi:hypothetical protein